MGRSSRRWFLMRTYAKKEKSQNCMYFWLWRKVVGKVWVLERSLWEGAGYRLCKKQRWIWDRRGIFIIRKRHTWNSNDVYKSINEKRGNLVPFFSTLDSIHTIAWVLRPKRHQRLWLGVYSKNLKNQEKVRKIKGTLDEVRFLFLRGLILS